MTLPTFDLLTKPQRERIAEAIAVSFEIVRPAPELRCSEWAAEHFYLSPESSGSGTEGKFKPWPTQVAILDCMGSDEIEVVTFRKSAGIGYTKMLTASLGYYHHHKKRNTLTYQPTDEDAKEFCKDTIDPMNRDVQVMEHLLKSSGRNNKENTLRTKHYAGSVLHVRGGTSANNFRRLRKDVVVYDELDGFDSDIEGEGDPVSLGDKRVRDSAYPKSIRGTTPTTKGQSLIEKSEKDADVTFRYNVHCPECHQEQHLEWGGKDVTYGIKWDDDDPETAHYICRGCGTTWDYSDLPELLENGRWLSAQGDWIDSDSKMRDDVGSIIPYPHHVAFLMWAGYSMTFTWTVMVREFLAAKDDPVLLKTFINTTLGEYWKEEVTEIDHEDLMQRVEFYGATIPNGVKAITFGSDVQTDRIEISFVGWGEGEEAWLLDHVVLPGDTQKMDVWNVAGKEIRRKFTRHDGLVLKSIRGCVDSGYIPDQIYGFSRKHGVRFSIPIKGSNMPGRPIANMPRRMNKETRVYLTEVGSDTAKDTLYRRLLIEEEGRGYVHFPATDAFDEEYFKQLTGEEKRPVRRQGRMTMAFQQAYVSVETLDCFVYALAALKISIQRFRLNLDSKPEGLTSPGEEPEQPQVQQPQQQRRSRQGQRRHSNWMKR